MSKDRADSAVEVDVWDDAQRATSHDDDDDITDDVFEMSSTSVNSHDKDNKHTSNPTSLPQQRKMCVFSGPRAESHKEEGQRGRVLLHHRQKELHHLWDVGSRRYAGHVSTTSIITRLHPNFCVSTAHEPVHPPTPPATPTLVLSQLPSSPTLTTEDHGGMVTLQSLNCRGDSGYIPSPSSTNSFTFSSDEDEPRAAAASRLGVTPPIDIPCARRRPAHQLAIKEQRHQEEATPKASPVQDWTPVQRGRLRSCPEQITPSVPLRAPVLRFPTIHGRHWSNPATTPDGQPLLTAPAIDTRTNTSRDRLIDLTEEGGASGGHRRRVLVLALPDLIVDTEGRASGACTPPYTTPSSQSFAGSFEFSDTFELPRGIRARPAWRRHRALSCDVTLAVELGQELRRIGDNFSSTHASAGAGENFSVWRHLRNSFSSSLPSSE
ncbi:uncharacterized protein LOC121863614 [Homarus americanus]|uniref:uncharacterized protein LOC121863614 n=1 Tax=Homarus americanus TaxID=6706 RepID=UPI001C452875|nr:uncharacterized protein LOC121863614 [Homarus americanus]